MSESKIAPFGWMGCRRIDFSIAGFVLFEKSVLYAPRHSLSNCNGRYAEGEIVPC
jgi:hypothetical protein